MINITFKIDEYPVDRSQPYSLITGIEGLLSIVTNGDVFFQETGILLLEFSKDLESWLQKIGTDENADFYYASMDFEEEPIIAFYYREDENLYKLTSVWGASDIEVTKNELVNASKLFINELNASIHRKLDEA